MFTAYFSKMTVSSIFCTLYIMSFRKWLRELLNCLAWILVSPRCFYLCLPDRNALSHDVHKLAISDCIAFGTVTSTLHSRQTIIFLHKKYKHSLDIGIYFIVLIKLQKHFCCIQLLHLSTNWSPLHEGYARINQTSRRFLATTSKYNHSTRSGYNHTAIEQFCMIVHMYFH